MGKHPMTGAILAAATELVVRMTGQADSNAARASRVRRDDLPSRHRSGSSRVIESGFVFFSRSVPERGFGLIRGNAVRAVAGQ
jgi:hypothetical protein